MNNIHPTAIIADNVIIGNNVTIGPYCIIGFPPEHRKHDGLGKGVIIGDNVTLTGLVTVDSGIEIPTQIKDYCYLMKHSHVGHDAVVSRHATVACGAKIGGHCRVGQRVNIGLNAAIHQFVMIPHDCMIGANTVLPRGWEGQPRMKYVGVGRCIGKNVRK